MKMHYLLSSFVLVSLLSFSAFATEGIDSDENSDLPLNARGVAVAKLKGTHGDPNSGVLEVGGLLDAKRLVLANAGAKIGPVDAACSNELEGVVRYYKDANTHELQYCNGSTWKAAFSGSTKTCPAQNFGCSNAGCFSLPVGKEGQLAYTKPWNVWVDQYQCIDGVWISHGGVSRLD